MVLKVNAVETTKAKAEDCGVGYDKEGKAFLVKPKKKKAPVQTEPQVSIKRKK